MQYAKQIINKSDTDDNDLKVITRYINDYTNYRENQGKPIKSERNSCFAESIELNRYLKSRRINSVYVRGFFIIEDIEGMEMTIADIMPTEMEEFMEYIYQEFEIYEDDIDKNSELEDDLGITENDLVQSFARHKGVSDFLTYPHAWVEVGGIIIDMTSEQFENACPSGITKLNYVRG